MTVMTAKYPGKCKKCGGHIEIGDEIDWTKETGAKHMECPVKCVVPTPVETVTIPTTIGTIQRLSHYGVLGAVWSDLTETQANTKIAQAMTHNKISDENVRKLLLAGNEIECSTTDWESVADKIRDKQVAEALAKRYEIEYRERNKARHAGRKFYTCRECGAKGYGGEYPFSTNPASGYCDDCC